MEHTPRQQHIITSLLSGVQTLPQLMELPIFRDITERTLQRDLGELLECGSVRRIGEARATTYQVTPKGLISTKLAEETLEDILNNEHRSVVRYDFSRLDILRETALFSAQEEKSLLQCHEVFNRKLRQAPPDIIRRERERITIELSWKSSQLEGNTYTLLETESLLKEGIPGSGKTAEETQMILNHKRALDFTSDQRQLFGGRLTSQTVVELHKILAEGLFSHSLRERAVGITGSVYRPLNNKFQLEEELKRFCETVNAKESVFDKALLAFAYICYLQPFNDGNKRTGRILANALLSAHDSFPLSLRAVSVNTYKLAMLAFYELGILGNAKQVLLEQARFAAENYAI